MAVYRFTFQFENIIYNDPIVGEELHCEHEPGNSRYPCSVAVKKQISREDKIVGHAFN